MNERDLAVHMAAGNLPSPSVFHKNTFFACRFSGTGVAYRSSLNEFALRDRDVWLSPDMLRRVIGVPLIIEHPPESTLDGAEFAQRCVGVVVLGYSKGDELWCIARVVDQDVAVMIDSGEFDTSPAVLFTPEDNETLVLDDGAQLLIEGDPVFIDHLAICPRGVWSKGDPEKVGIETSNSETQPTETST
jgi:hypothetical protein